MAVVISSDDLERHNVNKYNFKVLAIGGLQQEEPQKEEVFEPLVQPSSQTKKESSNDSVDSSALSQNSKNSLIESLMKKTEDMSSNFIKLQMKLESKEQEYEVALQKTKEEAYAEGMAQQAKLIQENEVANKNNGLVQFSNSVATLEHSAKEFETALENIKGSLMTAALDIAQEVLQIELSKNSNDVAKVLADNLIKELQSASAITLKVNPVNHGAISEKVGALEHIKIVSDSAISEGGVIAISNAGNIDSQISKRFEKVKRVALSE